MLTLAIETSGKAGSIALLHKGSLLEEVELSATGRRHARTLVPEIGNLLKNHSFAPSDVTLVAVSIGPGSFTGLRVGIVCAKTFAYAVGCDIIGVDTFLAIASASPADINDVWVIEDALRGEISAGRYTRAEEQWTCVTKASLVPIETWLTEVGPFPVTGPGIAKHQTELNAVTLVEESFRHPQAKHIATVGEQLYQSGNKGTPWNIAPHYMRRSYAEEKAEESST